MESTALQEGSRQIFIRFFTNRTDTKYFSAGYLAAGILPAQDNQNRFAGC